MTSSRPRPPRDLLQVRPRSSTAAPLPPSRPPPRPRGTSRRVQVSDDDDFEKGYRTSDDEDQREEDEDEHLWSDDEPTRGQVVSPSLHQEEEEKEEEEGEEQERKAVVLTRPPKLRAALPLVCPVVDWSAPLLSHPSSHVRLTGLHLVRSAPLGTFLAFDPLTSHYSLTVYPSSPLSPSSLFPSVFNLTLVSSLSSSSSTLSLYLKDALHAHLLTVQSGHLLLWDGQPKKSPVKKAKPVNQPHRPSLPSSSALIPSSPPLSERLDGLVFHCQLTDRGGVYHLYDPSSLCFLSAKKSDQLTVRVKKPRANELFTFVPASSLDLFPLPRALSLYQGHLLQQATVKRRAREAERLRQYEAAYPLLCQTTEEQLVKEHIERRNAESDRLFTESEDSWKGVQVIHFRVNMQVEEDGKGMKRFGVRGMGQRMRELGEGWVKGVVREEEEGQGQAWDEVDWQEDLEVARKELEKKWKRELNAVCTTSNKKQQRKQHSDVQLEPERAAARQPPRAAEPHPPPAPPQPHGREKGEVKEVEQEGQMTVKSRRRLKKMTVDDREEERNEERVELDPHSSSVKRRRLLVEEEDEEQQQSSNIDWDDEAHWSAVSFHASSLLTLISSHLSPAFCSRLRHTK